MRWLVVVFVVVGCRTQVDPCEGVVCDEGHCVLDRGAPACMCNEGFVLEGGRCVRPGCTPNPCLGLPQSVCTLQNGVEMCACPANTVAQDGTCVRSDLCQPNPCTLTHQRVCVPTDGVARCLCDPGYTPEGPGCSVTPVWSCADQHSDAGEDSAEPDECPSLGASLEDGRTLSRSLMPKRDHDWFRLAGVPGHVYRLQATATPRDFPLLLEVFAPDALRVIASDTRAGATAVVEFAAPLTGSLFARVRALRENDSGTYEVSLLELGVDDFGEDPTTAVRLMPGTTFSGEVQFEGDLDVVRLLMPAQTEVRLEAADGGRAPLREVVVEVLRADGGLARRLAEAEASTAVVRVEEPLILRARGRTPLDRGPFRVTTTLLEADDYGSEPAWATPVVLDGQSHSGQLEHAGDLDEFVFTPTAGHAYAVECNSNPCTARAGDAQGTVWGGSNEPWLALTNDPVWLWFTSNWSNTWPLFYTWSLTDLGTDDHTEVPGTPVETIGAGVSGRLEVASDVDGFNFPVIAGHILRVTATGSVPPVVRLLDSAGTLVAESRGGLKVLVKASGTMRATVTASGNPRTVGYVLTVADEGVDDHGDTSATATPLSLGTAASGALQHDADVDVFSFSATADHLYGLRCEGTSACWPLTVRDPAGQVVATYYTTSTLHVSLAGRWTLEFTQQRGQPSGGYRLTVTDLGAEDHGDTPGTATPIPVPGSVSGAIAYADDRDVFSFSGRRGHAYRLSCLEPPTASCWSYTRVTDATGTTLGPSGWGDLLYCAAETQTLFAEVSGGFGSRLYSYALTVADEGVDDHGDTLATATPLAVGATVSGQVQCRGDVDVFTSSLTAGRLVTVTATGPCSTAWRTPSGNVTSILNERVSSYGFKTAETGVHAFEVTAYLTGQPCAYSLSIADVGLDDHGDTAGTGTPITVGAAATSGVLEIDSDVDVFTFTAPQNRLVRASCTTGSMVPGCMLSVRAPDGTPLSSSYSGTSTQATALVTTAGTYAVAVSRSSPMQSKPYAVRVEDLGVEDHGNDAAHATTATPGVATFGALEYPNDVDALAVSLTQGNHSVVLSGTDTQFDLLSPTGYVLTRGWVGTTAFIASPAGVYVLLVRSSGNGTSWSVVVQ